MKSGVINIHMGHFEHNPVHSQEINNISIDVYLELQKEVHV